MWAEIVLKNNIKISIYTVKYQVGYYMIILGTYDHTKGEYKTANTALHLK